MDFLSDNTSRETRMGTNLISLRFTDFEWAHKLDSRDVSAVREQVR
jgi:hypothetical protein